MLIKLFLISSPFITVYLITDIWRKSKKDDQKHEITKLEKETEKWDKIN